MSAGAGGLGGALHAQNQDFGDAIRALMAAHGVSGFLVLYTGEHGVGMRVIHEDEDWGRLLEQHGRAFMEIVQVGLSQAMGEAAGHG